MMEQFGFIGGSDDLDDIFADSLYEDEWFKDDWKKEHTNSYQERIDELNQEKTEIQSKISTLEDAYNKEEQISIDAYNRAQQIVEQRRQEAQQAQETANEVVQAEERKQQAIKETESVSESTDISDDFKEAEVEIKSTENQVDGLSDALRSFGLNDGVIDAMTKDFEELGITIKKIKSTLNDDGSVRLNVNGVDKFGNNISTIRDIDVDGNISSPINTSVTQNFREAEESFKRLKSLGKEINGLEIKIATLDTSKNKDQINELIAQLRKLETEYDDLFNASENKLSSSQIDELVNDIVKGSEKLDAVKAKVSDLRNELSKKINANISLGNYDDEIDALKYKTDSLSDDNFGWANSLKQVENAYEKMLSAAKANTGNLEADRENLIQAEKEYAEALERTSNLIKQQSRLEAKDARNQKLKDDRDIFKAKIDAWLETNSAATKKFGSTLLDLKAQAEGCDRVTLNHLEKQFTKVDKEAEKAGLKMRNFGDRIKDQVRQYVSYLSVAEVFMEVTQMLRNMFEQVKLIDSAMTELKKVTNETDASYNKFLTNASSRAKEIGTTIDGLVQSTADFARLGYDFVDAQGLAEVANIYAVVGDDIDSVETATQSLISTLTAFKDEANGLSDSDFALSIVDKMNEVSNNFAISSGGIGDALQRSASSMMAANNSLDETIALITAANTVVQDPDAVGTAFKTISMRIRGAKTE